MSLNMYIYFLPVVRKKEFVNYIKYSDSKKKFLIEIENKTTNVPQTRQLFAYGHKK